MKTVLLMSAIIAAMFSAAGAMCRVPAVHNVPQKLPLAASEESSLAVSPDGQTLAVGGGTFADTVLLYNRHTHHTQILRIRGSMFNPPRPDREIDPALYYMSAASVQFSPDGRTLVNGGTAINGAVGENSSLNIWDARTGKHLRLFGMGSVKGPGVAFSPNGKLVACSGQEVKTSRALYGREIRFWSAETGKPAGIIQTQTPISALDFSPDGRLVATGGIIPSPFVQVWNVHSHREVWSQRLPGNLPLVTSVRFSPNGRFLATGSQEGIAFLWEAKTGRLVSKFTAVHSQSSFYPSSAPDAARVVVFSADGKRLATGGTGGVNIWSLPSHKQVQTLQAVMPIAFLPDGRHLLTVDASRTGINHLLIWQIH